MIYYKLTVLKDFPGFKRGQVFNGISKNDFDNTLIPLFCDGINLSEIIDVAKEYPDYINTEPDYSFALDIPCDCCKNNKTFPYINTDQYNSDGEIYVKILTGLECAICGKKREFMRSDHHVNLIRCF